MDNRVGSSAGYWMIIALGSWTSLPCLGLIRQPTLFWAATTTRSSRRSTPVQATPIPHARLHIYHGGHLGLLTESDELVPVIETFLSGASADE